MFSDGLKLIEGSSIINAVVAGGVDFPSIPSFGELFYRTDLTALFIYNGGWVQLQEYDADLNAIAALAGTSGFLKKSGANTWVLDTNVYLTANQNITLSGDISGSGSTAITTTLATVNSNVGSFGSTSAIPILTVDAKGRITAVSNSASIAATTAATLATARTIALSGAATGTATSFNGSANITIPVTALNADNLSSGTVPSARLTGTYGISVTGNAATATKLATARTISVSGDATWSTSFDGSANAAGILTLSTVATAGTYGTSTSFPNITIDAKGRTTSITTVNLGSMAFQDANAVTITGGSATGLTINNSPIGATTASSGAFTTLSASDVTTLSGANNQLRIRGATSTNRQITFDTNTLSRWVLRVNNIAESGANAGSNFNLISVADNGTTETLVLSIPRTTNIVDFKFTPTINGVNIATTTGNVATADKWSTARTLSLTGDATASLSVDGSANVSSPITLATVNSNTGSFGGVANSLTVTVNAKGLVTAISTSPISITSSQVSNFTESVQDVVGAVFVNGGGITATYNDTANTITLGSNATSTNTANTIVLRDATGSFSATDISLSGNMSLSDNDSTIDIGSLSVIGTPTINFHSSGNSVSNDSKIYATGGTSTAGNGTLVLQGNTISILGSESITSGASSSNTPYLKLQPSDYAGSITKLQVKTPSINSWEFSVTDSTNTVAGNLAFVSSTASVTGSWQFNSPVTVAEPLTASHATTKQYVDQSIDNAITGLDTKQSVRVATTANITLSGIQTVDGILLVAGDRVLVKNQTTASENGIYIVASGLWTRSLDANASAEVTAGLYTFVTGGTQNANSGWVLTTSDPIAIGTTALNFTQFNGLGQVIAGSGLTKTGNQIDAVGTSGRIVVNADAIDLATAGTAGSYRSVTTDAYGRVTSGTNPTTIAGYGLTDATQRAQTNFLTGTSVGSIRADDVRNLSNPSTGIGFTKGARVRFSALEDNNNAPYADVIDLSTWTDSSGGSMNSLYFSKASQLIYHKYAAPAATSWTTKTIAYLDSTVSKAAQLETSRSITATGDASWTVDFNGTANVSAALTLATVNSSPESNAFKRITVNGKGLVTGLSTVLSSDITTALGFTPVNKAGDTMSGSLEISTASGNSNLIIHKANVEGNKSQIILATNNLSVWDISSAAITDHFVINRYDNAGLLIGPVLSADRATGVVSIPLISGALTGNASTATKLETVRSISATGDASWSVTFDGSANATSSLTLTSVNSNIGTYGSSTQIPTFTVDAKGRITAATMVDIDVGGSDLYYFEETISETGINASVPIAALTSTYTAFADVDVVIGPKGAGSFATDIADATSAGGNKRGANAVDLQVARSSATMVASGSKSIILGGENNTSSGTHAISAGFNNTASGNYSTALGNSSTTKNKTGAFAYASGSFSSQGDAQSMLCIARAITTTNVQTELTFDGSAITSQNTVTIDSDSTVFFDIDLVARRTDIDNESAAWKISGCADRNALASSTAFVGSPNVQIIARDTSAWQAVVAIDTTAGSLRILVTGENGKNIRWVAKINLVEVKG
jgi:phage-related tail fiber protein